MKRPKTKKKELAAWLCDVALLSIKKEKAVLHAYFDGHHYEYPTYITPLSKSPKKRPNPTQ